MQLLRYAKAFSTWRFKQATVLDYPPEDVSIEVTNSCNFKCAYCLQSDPNHFKVVAKSFLEPSRAAILLRKIRSGGVRTHVLHWTLDGEPFMNTRFHEICELGLAHGFHNMIFSTNGMFATVERLRRFPRTKKSTYTLCVDFCEDETYFETHRGTKGSWSTIRQNLLDIASAPDLDHVRLKITDISSYQIQDVADLTRRFERLKAMFTGLHRVRVVSRVFHNATGYLSTFRGGEQRYRVCPYPWFSLYVASNGDVVACCRDLQHKTVLGNLFETDLSEIWNGSASRFLRQSLLDENPGNADACRDCDMPYSQDKLSLQGLLRSAAGRLQISLR